MTLLNGEPPENFKARVKILRVAPDGKFVEDVFYFANAPTISISQTAESITISSDPVLADAGWTHVP